VRAGCLAAVMHWMRMSSGLGECGRRLGWVSILDSYLATGEGFFVDGVEELDATRTVPPGLAGSKRHGFKVVAEATRRPLSR